jgi:hypothetical protein
LPTLRPERSIAAEGLDCDGSVCDRVEGVQRYLDILRGILTPDDFELKVQRVSRVSDG